MFILTYNINFKELDEKIEILQINDIFNIFYESPLEITTDEYGYGWIIKGECVENEYVITIQFENGSSKKFMPAYQSNSLTLIMEE